MVCYGNGRMFPFLNRLNKLFYRNEGIHIAHNRMEMEFYTRRRVRIFSFDRTFRIFHDAVDIEDIIIEHESQLQDKVYSLNY